MIRARRQKTRSKHFVLVVNRAAGGYRERAVSQLIAGIRRAGANFTVLEPSSAMETLQVAEAAVRSRGQDASLPQGFARRGKVTALVACGGDGTVNLVARAALQGRIPLGILPLGQLNNIANSLCANADVATAVKKIIDGKYRKIDVGQIGDQPFIGSAGFGFIPEMAELLNDRPTVPRMGLAWSQMGARAAANVQLVRTVIKIDAFRFDVTPILLHINLLEQAAGLPLAHGAVCDDGEAEVIFDLGDQIGEFSSFTRLARRKKYLYGSAIRMYRGRIITIQPTRDRLMYLDGELIEPKAAALEAKVAAKRLMVFC